MYRSYNDDIFQTHHRKNKIILFVMGNPVFNHQAGELFSCLIFSTLYTRNIFLDFCFIFPTRQQEDVLIDRCGQSLETYQLLPIKLKHEVFKFSPHSFRVYFHIFPDYAHVRGVSSTVGVKKKITAVLNSQNTRNKPPETTLETSGKDHLTPAPLSTHMLLISRIQAGCHCILRSWCDVIGRWPQIRLW